MSACCLVLPLLLLSLLGGMVRRVHLPAALPSLRFELAWTAPCTALYCRLFVERGGVELLLTLYRLPRLPPTFGSTNASHRWVLACLGLPAWDCLLACPPPC